MATKLDLLDVAGLLAELAQCAARNERVDLRRFACADVQARMYRTADFWRKLVANEYTVTSTKDG